MPNWAYYLWVENGTTEYYTNLEALTKEVENITGSKNLNSRLLQKGS